MTTTRGFEVLSSLPSDTFVGPGDLHQASGVLAGRVVRANPYPGALVRIDVKKLECIPDGGGWKALCRAATVDHQYE